MAEIHDITKSDFDTEILGAEGLHMVYYYAPWCKPCGEMAEVIATVADEISEKMAVSQVNTDQEGEIVTQQKIRVLPTFQIFKSGKVLNTLQGPYSKLELLGQLSNIITDEGSDQPETESEK